MNSKCTYLNLQVMFASSNVLLLYFVIIPIEFAFDFFFLPFLNTYWVLDQKIRIEEFFLCRDRSLCNTYHKDIKK